MTLHESEEILPLIDTCDRNRNDQSRSYKSLSSCINEEPRVLLKRKLNYRFNYLPSDKVDSNQSQTSFQNVASNYGENRVGSKSSSAKIVYAWKDVNVYCTDDSKRSTSLWKKFKSKTKKNRFSFEKRKHILKNAFGIANPGEILAIMGSSGAGKTTLLNALTFQLNSNFLTKGCKYINGHICNNKSAIANLSAYVEQDYLVMGTLTVREHLIFQALVKTDDTLSHHQKLKKVDDLINELGLEKCKDTVIGYPGRLKGISGGELKRLSFASELLTNPSIIFCDEPTSGLDSSIALSVVKVLKTMAVRGRTVICTIHQPSCEIFSLFDKILLLAQGKTAFLGTPNDATKFFIALGAPPFANFNSADFFIQMLSVIPGEEKKSVETIDFICESFEHSQEKREIKNEIENCSFDWFSEENVEVFQQLPNNFFEDCSYKAAWFTQFRALFWRSWLNIIKEPLLVKVRLFQTLVLSLMVGIIYQHQKLNEDGVMNINGVLFTFLTNMTFQNLFAVISAFCSELPIFLKEHANKLYRTDAYFISKTLTEIPIFIFLPLIFIAITYYWIGLNPGINHFVGAAITLVLVTNVATSFGYFISCISSNVTMALSIGPPVIIPLLLFGGFLLNIGVTPKYFNWLSYLSWFKYGNEALLINQWSDIDNIECNKLNDTCSKNGDIILEIYHFQKQNYKWDIVSLFFLILLFRLLAFFALVLRTIKYRRN